MSLDLLGVKISSADLEAVEREDAMRKMGAERGELRERFRTLREFVAGAWPVLEPGRELVPGWHIDAICEHLEAVTRGEIKRLIINVPPRHMKSLTVAVFWPTWVWTFKPELRWLFASYAEKLSIRDSLKCRRLIESLWYQALWGDVFRLASDQNEKKRFENDRTGYRIATSVGGTGTGEGGDVVVFDDPHKVDEVESDVVREGVIDWWDGTMTTRLNDPDEGAFVGVMQRIHERDLAGHLLAKGGYTHLCLPAEYSPNHPFIWPDDPRTEPDALLWPDHFGAEAIAELKTALGSYRAAGQLQQLPSPATGGILKRGWWRYFPVEWLDVWEGPAPVAFFTSWDTGLKEKTVNDYAVGTAWIVVGANRYLVRRIRARMGLPETRMAVWELSDWGARQFSDLPQTHYVENAANGPEVVAWLKDKVSGLIAVSPDKDKVARAHGASAQIEAGNVFLPGKDDSAGSYNKTLTPSWVQELIEECARFPKGAHDDQVDSVTQFLNKVGQRNFSRGGGAAKANGNGKRKSLLERTF